MIGRLKFAAVAAVVGASIVAALPGVAGATGRAPAVPSGSARTAANAKKGVAAWAFDGSHRALLKSGVSWYYTWGTNHDGIATPAGVNFVPMIWGANSVTAATLKKGRHFGHYLLGFNEPDNA